MSEKLVTTTQLKRIIYGVITSTPSGSTSYNVKIDGVDYVDDIDFVTSHSLTVSAPFAVKDALVCGNDLFVFSDTACYKYNHKGWELFVNLQNTYDDLFFDTVVYNNLIYVMGKGNKAETINPATKASNKLSSSFMPYDLDIKSAVVYDGKIHIMGSNGTSADRTKHYAYDGTSWQSVSTLPISFVGDNCTLVMNDGIHMFFATYHYLWNGSAWQQLGNTPVVNIDGVVLNYNDEIHLIDGSTSSGVNTHYVLRNNSWTQLSALPCSTKMAVVYEGRIWIFDEDTNSDKIYTFNGTNWEELSYTCYKPRS